MSEVSSARAFRFMCQLSVARCDGLACQIDRKGNMDGHCDYKFYTGATFSGEMRHGERWVLPCL